ncbi:MAG: 2-aminoethylphosphonate--pyruvate transaminase [Cyclobacteriaceae bacterium]|nr:2-aminoethylphosphonate--pyruvate transaminase [Cyclobacteriaceae bacterium HetDA_MAG_MS6]
MQHSKDLKRTILLNPGPGTTSQKVKEALLVEDICPREEAFGDVMHQICDGILEIGHGKKTHEVGLFVASGTGAMEAALVSAIGPSDKVLILANGAYSIRMAKICEQYRIPFTNIGSFGEYPDVSDIEKKLTHGGFTHLAMIHHETSTGMMNPMEDIAKICQKRDVKLIVDAMSTYGAYPYNLEKTPVDFIFSSSNKCIHGMAGLSYVIFRKDRTEELKANSRGFYFDLYQQWNNLQVKNQLRFTPPVQICYSFLEAINETLKEGVSNRWSRYQSNWQILYDGLTSIGLKPFLDRDHESKILLALDLNSKENLDFDDLHDYLFERGITIYPGVIPEINTFRVAVIGDLYAEDMHQVVNHIKSYFES